MIDQGIKSRPQYQPLTVDGSGRRHLLLSDRQDIAPGAFANGCSGADFDARWCIAHASTVIPDPGPVADQSFRSESHLLIALRHRLGSETMGFRLYAVGTEPFLWTIFNVAQAAGLSREEIHFFAHGSAARRVFCNHCRTISEGVTTNITLCGGCGAHLFVRDHFSRRLNAFAGVQVDAEVPGEIPDVEELYS